MISAQNRDFLRGPRIFWPLKWHERQRGPQRGHRCITSYNTRCQFIKICVFPYVFALWYRGASLPRGIGPQRVDTVSGMMVSQKAPASTPNMWSQGSLHTQHTVHPQGQITDFYLWDRPWSPSSLTLYWQARNKQSGKFYLEGKVQLRQFL